MSDRLPFTPITDLPGVRRTREQWADYYAELARQRVATAIEADELRQRWQRNSDEYFRRKDGERGNA